jgi:hypothetical protein
MQGKFKKAYAREVEQLADRSYWHEVEIVAYVGAPLLKRVVRQQRKNRMRGVLKVEVERKQVGMRLRKQTKKIRGKFKCPNCGELGHRKTALSAPLMEQRKGKILSFVIILFHISYYKLFCFLCRKRKPRKNTTNGWFLKEATTSSLHVKMLVLHRFHMKM